jgi:hypothetical protein
MQSKTIGKTMTPITNLFLNSKKSIHLTRGLQKKVYYCTMEKIRLKSIQWISYVWKQIEDNETEQQLLGEKYHGTVHPSMQ